MRRVYIDILCQVNQFCLPRHLFADPDPDPGGKINADSCKSGSSLTNFVKINSRRVFFNCKIHKKKLL